MGDSMCVVHITEYMSPDINGRGTDVLKLSYIINSVLNSKKNYIISGKWIQEERNCEEINGVSVYRVRLFQHLSGILKTRVVGMVLILSIPLILSVGALRIIRQLKSSEECQKILIFGHHLWGGVAAALLSAITGSPAYLVLYGTARAYGGVFGYIESFFLILLRNSFHRVFVLDNGSNLPRLAMSAFGPDNVVIFPQIVPDHAVTFKPKVSKVKVSNSFRIMWLSGFNSSKSPDQAILGFSYFVNSLKKRGKYNLKNIEFFMAGDGHLLEKCKRLANQAGVDRQVVFLGRVPPQVAMVYLSKSDLLLATSRTNSNFERVVLEASYMGVPIVVTDTGRTRNFLKDHTHALICSNDPKLIGNCILEMFLNPKLRKKLSINARKLINLRYLPQAREEIFKRAFLLSSRHEGRND